MENSRPSPSASAAITLIDKGHFDRLLGHRLDPADQLPVTGRPGIAVPRRPAQHGELFRQVQARAFPTVRRLSL